MKNAARKTFCILLCILLAAASATVLGASESPEEEAVATAAPRAQLDAASIAAPYAILIEANTGKVLFEKEADTKVAPASVTKIMSLLLIMEAIDRGDISPEDNVTASPNAAQMGGSQIWLEAGEVMSVDMLLKAVCIASANDATYALAEYVAGSQEAFVGMMNARAVELGMTNTHFVNSYGLDAEDHYTTARDMALCAAELLKHELITRYSTVWMDTLRGGANELVNTNKLVRTYDGITGLKTGTTSQARSCLVATAERNGFALIAAVFRADTSDQRFASARTLLDYGYANYTLFTPEPPQERIFVPIKGSTLTEVEVVAGDIPSSVLPKGGDRDLQYHTALDASLRAPLPAGSAVGSVTVQDANGQTVAAYPLVTAQEAPRLDWLKALLLVLKQAVSVGPATAEK
ncbi:MAG: D-alanyl-D-alanine carboxypeptidase [Clostridia bacterium]|nr:D-alanyl-D-alanine carboxypeptidase [Clostridia bacterium]